MIFVAFLYLQFVFVMFWQREISNKAARQVLVKLTLRVNFTNILGAKAFSKFFLVQCLEQVVQMTASGSIAQKLNSDVKFQI